MTWAIGEERMNGVFQDNFFNIIEKPEFVVKGLPTRTVGCFWREDALPTAHLIRDIYIGGGVSYDEKEILDYTWRWVQKDISKMRNFEMPNSRHRVDLDTLRTIPIEVLLNRSTAYFFAMEEDFKTPESRNIFEAFVAFKPETVDWENDVRRVTFDFVHKLRTRPYETGVHIIKAMREEKGAYSNEALVRLGLDERLLDRFETIDSITYSLLFYYHHVLFKREKAVLQSLGMR